MCGRLAATALPDGVCGGGEGAAASCNRARVDLPRVLAGTVLYFHALETANRRLCEVRSQVIQ